ncbi:hypothetical protein [Streptomyces iranensis]|uniref:Secreted protein n=1 Tax=Streptomyces iranensis TaxID=576784 RepID=A0ABS4NA20_9ACTN|nr:hypothetical protein [Streptomyces iranensis]MBP2068844.1 hypothetical protein [Streptomyces iranensis]
MTRTKKTVVLWALATGMLAASTSPALADRNQTVAPPDRNNTILQAEKLEAGPAGATNTRTSPLAAKHDSVPCGHKKVNFTWKSGTTHTTIYANNHCGHKKVVFVKYGNAFPAKSCWRVKKGKSHSTVRTPPGSKVKNITKGHGC